MVGGIAHRFGSQLVLPTNFKKSPSRNYPAMGQQGCGSGWVSVVKLSYSERVFGWLRTGSSICQAAVTAHQIEKDRDRISR